MIEPEPWWAVLLREQRRSGFRDLAGANASLLVPISDRLITRVIASRLPPSAPIRELDVVAEPGELLTVRVRLTKPAFLPPIQLRLAIVEQPQLPSSPFVGLAIVSQGLAALAGTALKFVNVLPPGVAFDGGRFRIDLAAILHSHQADDLLAYVSDLRITTADGRIVLHATVRA